MATYFVEPSKKDFKACGSKFIEIQKDIDRLGQEDWVWNSSQ